MPKKGKGKKGKSKPDSSGDSAEPGARDRPGPSTSETTGSGREKPPTAKSPAAESSEFPELKAAAQDPSAKQFFESDVQKLTEGMQKLQTVSGRGKPSSAQSPITESPAFPELKDTVKGRGRGRGKSTQDTTPYSPGIQHQKVMKPDSPKLSASAVEVAEPLQVSAPKKKVFSKVEQEKLLEQSGLSFKQESPSVKKMKFAERPKTLPEINAHNRIQLYVNYFKLKYDKNRGIYHYDIDIFDSTKDKKIGKSVLSQGRTAKEDIKKNVRHVEREKRRNMGKAKCRALISKLFEENAALKNYCPVYDGQKNLFTSKELPLKHEPIPIDIKTDRNKDERFFIAITPVVKKDKTNVISLEPLLELYSGRSREIPYEVLLVYELVMSHREGTPQQVHFRNSFFSLTERKEPIGCGLEVWFGYHQNVQLADVGPVVIINLAAKAFHKSGPVINYANDVLGGRDITKIPKLNAFQIKDLSDALRGVQIKVTHQPHPRKYKIKEVMKQSAEELIIKDQKISVAQYILNKYSKKLLHPYLPCLLMQTGNNTTYMPMEVCEIIPGQPKIGKLSPELTSKMIRQTAVPPESRMKKVSETAKKVNDFSRKGMSAFGLLMDINLMKIDGRIMAAPQLEYKCHPDKSCFAKPDIKGVWRIEDGKKFFKPTKINRWVVVSFADERQCRREILDNYCKLLCLSARKCGMELNRPEYIEIYGMNIKTEQVLSKAKEAGAQFAIVVLNRRDNRHTYDQVKFLADFQYNLVTQCMEDKTLLRVNDQITTNVCLKINVKLGGINHILYQKLQIFSKPVIVLGVDAIHWARGYGYPSIVSVVGSLNPTATRYALACDFQRNEKHENISQEIIRNMKGISMGILDTFAKVNGGRHPFNIIVFRDGVSEGQFQHALDYEVSGIQQACQELFQKVIPITFIVVQKRHHTRFFPVNPRQGVGRNQNVPPGTCVDRDITHPVFYDYFICSHEGIQGTSKPAHYTVLHNDCRLNCLELQELCYFLCHTYVRCTRSVSLPAPVMYADLAAARAKKYADLFIGSENISVSSEEEHKDLPPQVVSAIKSMKSFDNNMFYV